MVLKSVLRLTFSMLRMPGCTRMSLLERGNERGQRDADGIELGEEAGELEFAALIGLRLSENCGPAG